MMLLASLLLALAAPLDAQPLVGAIEGRLTDSQQAVITNARVTLTGPQGGRTATTDAAGRYRFDGLHAGAYDLSVDVSGFRPRTDRGLPLGPGETLLRNIALEVGGPAETIVVEAPVVLDAGAAATRVRFSPTLLFQAPINVGPFNAATALIDLAPGVNRGSALGGDTGTASALLLDGVDSRDPDAGAPWVFYNYNIVQDLQVGGLGAPAAYGGFTGAVLQVTTKSGGNRRSGLIEFRHTRESLAAGNLAPEQTAANPTLGESSVLTGLNDVTAQMGGPLRADRLFYWTSLQRYALSMNPAGPISRQTEVSPRLNTKLTWRLSPTHTLAGSVQYDRYDITGLPGFAQTFSTDSQTLRQKSPGVTGSASYQRVLGTSTQLDVRFAGFSGSFSTTPVDPASVRLDVVTGAATGGGGFSTDNDRSRGQLNASLSRVIRSAGQHDVQVGVEVERSRVHNQQAFSNHLYYLDFGGLPYLAFTGAEYDIEAVNRRTSAFVQDGWRAGRLTLDLGVRLDVITGRSPRQSEPVYTPAPAVGPRLGAAFDLTGQGSAIVAGSYGRYFEGAAFSPYSRAVPGYADFVSYDVQANGRLVEFDRVREHVYAVEDDIRHFGMEEVTVSWRQRLLGMRVVATGWWRRYRNITASVIPRATWASVPFTNPLDGKAMPLYRWVNRTQTDRDYLITNLDEVTYRDASGAALATVEPSRQQRGVMVVATRSLRRGVEGHVSYVWSKGEGTVGNRTRDGFGGTTFENPNTSVVNTDGSLENDRTHELKAIGIVQLPFGLVASGVFRAVSGRTYTPVGFVAGATVNTVNALSVNLEPRGSRRYETERQLDLRIERAQRFERHRLGVFVDVQNVTNANTVLSVQTRYPFRAVGSTLIPFEAPVAVTGARQATLGLRWSF